MRIVGVRNSPVGSDRAADQQQSRTLSTHLESRTFRPLLNARAGEGAATPLEEKAVAQKSAPVSSEEGEVRLLAINELLFGMGEPKSKLYVVEAGSLAVYEPRWNGHRAVIEFAFPGDIIGLGFLETHACSARATTASRVRCVPLSAQDKLIVGDPRTQSRLADAIEREIDFLRESSARFSRQSPRGRLAAFLLTLSRENEQEGRDPTLLAQPLECGVVADFLALSIERLGSLMVELERRGLIEPLGAEGVRLKNLAGLEGLAGRALSVSAQSFNFASEQ
jgi:CRP/FNR family transcriptional regulator, anaerobic regulatory protein